MNSLDLQLQLNILYVIICVYILYKIYNKSTENFALPPFIVSDDAKTAINDVYKVDVDAIRNLSAIASKLQDGGLTVPGNLTVTGNTNIKGNTTSDGFITTKGIRSNETWFPFTDGNNYIRGNTILDGNLTHNGALTHNGNATITGAITTGQRIFAATGNRGGGIWVDGSGANGVGSFIGCQGDGSVWIWRDGVNVAKFDKDRITFSVPVSINGTAPRIARNIK